MKSDESKEASVFMDLASICRHYEAKAFLEHDVGNQRMGCCGLINDT